MKLQELFEAKEKSWFCHDRKAWEKAVAALEVDDDGQDFAKSDGKLIAKWYPDRDEGWVLTEAKSTKGPLSDRQLKNVIRSAVMGQRIIADGKTVWPGQETTVINSNKGKMAWTNKGEAFTQKMKNGKFNKVVIKAYNKNGAGYSWLTDEEFDTSALGEAQLVEEHPYSVKILYKGKDKRWPKLKGEIYEQDVLIGTFTRAAVQDGYVPPIEYKFRTDKAKARFDDFSGELSIPETIEALLP